MANATSTQLQELYVAYFGRAADPTGLDYWTERGITTSTFAADMYAQAEFKDAYGSLSTESQVNQIYKNLFDREADVTGLTYWTQQINLGTLKVAEIANHLIWAAQNNSGSADDKTALTNRTAAAVAYTAEVKGSVAAILAYQPESTGTTFVKGVNITEAVNYLSGIDKDTVHTAAGITTSVAVLTTNGVPSAAVSGKSITLTSTADVVNTTSATAALTTGSGNDVIYGLADGLLTSADVIDGGDGNDKVDAKITAASQTIKPKLTSIEELSIEITAANNEDPIIDLSSATSVTKVTLTGVDSAADESDVLLKGVQVSDAVTIDTNMAGANTWALATITYDSVTGTADSASVTIKDQITSLVIDGLETLSITSEKFSGALTSQDVETLTITTGSTSTNTSTFNALTQTADDLATLNLAGAGEALVVGSTTAFTFKGDAVVNITNTGKTTATLGALAAATNSLTVTGAGGKDTVDVTATSTGTVSVTTNDGDDTVKIDGNDVTVKTGAGNDTVQASTWASITKADTIDLGEGTRDRVKSATEIAINATDNATYAFFKNAEVLEVSKPNDHFSIDMDAFTGTNHIILSGGIAESYDGQVTSAGHDQVVLTTNNDDIVEIRGSIVGEGSGKSATDASTANIAGVGGDGIDLDPKVDNGNNISTIHLVGNVDITGGMGEKAKTAQTQGVGGDALIADKTDVLNLVVLGTQEADGTADTVTFTGGATGAATGLSTTGAAGDGIEIASGGKIVLTSGFDPDTSKAALHNHIDLGVVNGTNAIVDGSAFLGKITATVAVGNVSVTGGGFNDVLTTGTGVDTVSGGAGIDTIDPGTGADIITLGAGADIISIASGDAGISTEKITDFETGALGVADLLKYTAVTLIGDATGTDVSSAITGGAAGGDTLTATVSNGFITLGGNAIAKIDTQVEIQDIFELCDANTTAEIGAIEFEGSTYFFGISTADEVCDDTVKLEGLTGITAISTTAAANSLYVAAI